MTTATATAGRTMLLTGAESPLGKLVLKRLASVSSVGRVFTAGALPVRGRKVKHLKTPWENEKIVEPLRKEKVETIVHLASLGRAGSEASFERDVLGTMTLLSAAAEAGVRRIVLSSSYTVYGPHYNNPNHIPETRRIRLAGRGAGSRDAAEIERHVHDFARHFSEHQLAILRFAPIVGPTVDSPMMKYLSEETCPVLMGFDPLLQLLHEEDAADAVAAAAGSGVSGPVNVAPDGVVPLLKALRFLKKEILTVPYLPMQASEQFLAALKRLPFDAGYLRYSCSLDNSKLVAELGFRPKRTSSEALRALGPDA